MRIPILLIFFVKDTVKKVFDELKKIKPARLYLASDGPRENKKGEKEKVEGLRRYVIENIDWDCKVKTLFRERNLGCRLAVPNAITWFFENEDMGIILEDDVILVDTAYRFVEEMLYKFKEDKRIGSVSLFNPIAHKMQDLRYSYYYSKYNFGYGAWATWRDRWKEYDINMKGWFEWKNTKGFEDIHENNFLVKSYWEDLFDFICLYDKDNWDAQWTFTHFKNNWLSVVPTKNQVLNIGYGYKDAVNTSYKAPDFIKRSIPQRMEFPLVHNPFIYADRGFKRYLEKEYFSINLLKVFGYKLKLLLHKVPFTSNKARSIYDFFKNMYYHFR